MLLHEALVAMQHAAVVTGHTETDTVNRALCLYDAIVTQQNLGFDLVLTCREASFKIKMK